MTRQKDNPIQKLLGEKMMDEVEFFGLACLKISFGEKFCIILFGVAPILQYSFPRPWYID
jgi:hypothetical protein